MPDGSFGPWVIFFFFSSCFLILMDILLHIQVLIYRIRDREKGDDEKGPKRRQTRRRLGPR